MRPLLREWRNQPEPADIAQVVGAKATRTTHPKTIRGFEALLSLVAGRRFQVDNAFLWKTKSDVVELIAKAGCAELIAESISCTHTWDITNEQSHCGYCSQCIDRRFAVMAAGQETVRSDWAVPNGCLYREPIQTRPCERRQDAICQLLEAANEVRSVEGPLQFLKSFPEVARTYSTWRAILRLPATVLRTVPAALR